MKILFINGSPNKNGNTANLASILLNGKEYETLNLTNFTIGSYGQTLPYDGLDKVIEKMKEADTIVIGSPLYWHNICGSVRNVLDRFYGKVDESELLGRKLYFVFQGAAPEKWMLDAGEYTMKRFASLYRIYVLFRIEMLYCFFFHFFRFSPFIVDSLSIILVESNISFLCCPGF